MQQLSENQMFWCNQQWGTSPKTAAEQKGLSALGSSDSHCGMVLAQHIKISRKCFGKLLRMVENNSECFRSQEGDQIKRKQCVQFVQPLTKGARTVCRHLQNVKPTNNEKDWLREEQRVLLWAVGSERKHSLNCLKFNAFFCRHSYYVTLVVKASSFQKYLGFYRITDDN